MAAPRFFLPVVCAFLLWNLMGIAAYFMQMNMDLAELAKTDPYQARIFRDMPSWAWAAYAIAVWLGLAGTIALFRRRRIAVPLYAISLAAVIVQFGYSFLGTDIWAVKGVQAAAFPALIVVIGLGELLFARSALAKAVLR